MSEIERLRQLESDHKEIVTELNHEIGRLRQTCKDSSHTIEDLQLQIVELEEKQLIEEPTIQDDMKLDFILRNWDKITLENLEAIVDNPMTI